MLFNDRSSLRLLGLAALIAAAGCGTRTVRDGVDIVRPDAGVDGAGGEADGGADAPATDAPTCPTAVPGEAKAGGEACECDIECANGYCQEGVCCSGAACGMRPPGAACAEPSQCASGFCADGVCCSQACTGGCVSCNQPERSGECVPVPVGMADPHGVCRNDSAQSCGQSGMCNGQGGCAKHASGSSCGIGTCAGGRNLMGASECDGDGLCVGGQPLDCNPFACQDGACKQSCTADTDCIAPNVCRNGSCGPRGNGQNCTTGDQCASGNCVDGVCCNTACAGRCQFCASAGARGTCTPVRAGTRDPRAALGITDAALVCIDQGPSSCGTDGACDGSGGCRRYEEGTVCRAGRCDTADNAETAASVCTDGSCRAPAARSCAPYRGCSGSRCVTQCGSDSQCAAGSVCTDGDCGKRPVGAICSKNADCAAPGICAQGRCCATACNGTCMACDVAGAQGTCRPVPTGGADPTGACRDDACNNGCNGQGACRREAAGTSCRAATCAGATLTTHTCTAAGVCQPSAAPCPAGQMCMGNRCVPPVKKPLGAVCVAGDECASNVCVSGHCCATTCPAACRSCTAASMWTCAPRPNGTACGDGRTCTAGECVRKPAGAVCMDGIECASGSCLAGRCCAARCAGPPCLACTAANMFACRPAGEGLACGMGQICRGGACVAPCPPNQTMCGTACVNLRNDPMNCGACRKVCAAGRCVAGTCAGDCPAGQTRCPATGGCVDLQTDRNNCGACNNRCSLLPPTSCVMGGCRPGILPL